VPKSWRLGPKPNLNQVHDSYKRQMFKHAKSKFDDLAKTKCPPLFAEIEQHKIKGAQTSGNARRRRRRRHISPGCA